MTSAPPPQRIDGAVVRTPMLKSRTLSEIIGAEVWLKFENLQFTAAYKERGALNKLLQLTREERARGRDRGVRRQSRAGRRLSRQAARHPGDDRHAAATPTIKVTQTEGHGANVHASRRRAFDDAYAKARELEKAKGYVFVHPFDDPQVIAGQGTHRAGDARGRARPRHDRRADRRRRADVGHRASPRERSSRTSS